MQKIFGLLFMAVAVWTAIELYTNGSAGAFNGAFASSSDEKEREEEFTWAGERAGNKLRDKHDERVEAIERMTRE